MYKMYTSYYVQFGADENLVYDLFLDSTLKIYRGMKDPKCVVMKLEHRYALDALIGYRIGSVGPNKGNECFNQTTDSVALMPFMSY